MSILSTQLAQDIVTRTMKIIPYNVNVMDASGSIIASGNPARIGELHTGAMLALAKKLAVEIDDASARNMHGAQPGINLPLTVNGQLCGAVGLSGAPDEVRQFGELVRLTAEMILEQAQLTGELQRDTRYREAFVLKLINDSGADAAGLEAWARRLGVDFSRTHLVFVLELDGKATGPVEALTEIQRLQMRMLTRQPSALTAAAGSHELVILDFDKGPANASASAAAGPIAAARSEESQAWAHKRLHALSAMLQEEGGLAHTLAMGIALSGIDGVAISYQSARAAARIGRAKDPRRDRFSYYEQALPVLLSGLGAGWPSWANQASKVRRIGEITGLDLGRLEDRLLLYVSALLTAN
jgi:carbohydrate diacid regulator